jgi:hypothetical protein
MAPPLISGRGTSRFIVDTPNKRTIQNEIMGQTKNSLLQQAASLLPDYQTLSDSLLEYDLPTADRMRVQQQLDQMTSVYMEAYSRDPFYAFEDNARRMTRRMQALVRDPQLKQAELIKKQNDKEYERGATEGLLNKVMVNNQGIAVLRNGVRTYTRTPKQTDQILTAEDEYNYLNQVVGSAGGQYRIGMRSVDDAMRSVRAAFENVGDTEWKKQNIDPTQLLSSIQSGSTNEQQLQTAIDLLINKGGLSNEDWNTLNSEYLSSVASGQIDGEFTTDAARRRTAEMIFSTASSRKSTSSGVTYEENPFLKASKTKSDIEKDATISSIERGLYGLNGTRPSVQVAPNGITTVGEINKIGAELFQTSTQSALDEESGVKLNSHKIKDLPLLANAADRMFVMAIGGSKAGDLVTLPADAYRHGVIADGSNGPDEEPAFDTQAWVGPDGNPVPPKAAAEILDILTKQNRKIPQEYRKYISADKEGKPTLQQGVVADVVMYVPKQESLWGTDFDTSQTSKLLDEQGYKMEYNSEDKRYINAHSGTREKVLKDGGIINMNDGYYKVRVKIPMKSYSQIRGGGGEKVYVNLDAAHLETSDFNKRGVEVNPDLLDDNAFIPNLRTQGLPKLSTYKK